RRRIRPVLAPFGPPPGTAPDSAGSPGEGRAGPECPPPVVRLLSGSGAGSRAQGTAGGVRLEDRPAVREGRARRASRQEVVLEQEGHVRDVLQAIGVRIRGGKTQRGRPEEEELRDDPDRIRNVRVPIIVRVGAYEGLQGRIPHLEVERELPPDERPVRCAEVRHDVVHGLALYAELVPELYGGRGWLAGGARIPHPPVVDREDVVTAHRREGDGLGER